MKTLLPILICIAASLLLSCSMMTDGDMIYVSGGTFAHTQSNFYGTKEKVPSFYISKYEITQKEWVEIMGSNPSFFKGDNLPVDNVSWYDAVEYCNKRSIRENLEPYYIIDKTTPDPVNTNENDELKWTVIINEQANGYRLPTEIEWEFAATGGKKSRNYVYSGSNKIDDVAWYWRNSGDEYLPGEWHWLKIENNNFSSKPVGSKKPNELGLYDMSGNVREWCWDWYADISDDGTKSKTDGIVRIWRGGGMIGGEQSCQTIYRSSFEPDARAYDQGFRVCRNR